MFTVLPLITGIFISYFVKKEIFSINNIQYSVLLITIAVLIIILYNFYKGKELILSFYIFALIIFGFVSFQFRHFNEMENNVSQKVKSIKNLHTTIKGKITENPEIKPESIRMILNDIEIAGEKADGQILVSVYRNKFKESEQGIIEYGSIVEIEGRLENLPERHNPGEFDYGEYLKLHGIDAAFYSYGFDKIKVTGKAEPSFYKAQIINPVKNYSVGIIDKYIGGEEGEYLKGLVLGERSNISKKTKEDFVNAGVSHIIAVSGLNVAYVIIVVWALLLLFPLKHTYKVFITLIFLVFYMNLTGNTPSIVRATIMASVFLFSGIFQRRANIYNIISFASLVILIYDPRQLFDAGFILSFTAIISIVVLHPKIESWMKNIRIYSNLNTEKPVGKSVKFILTLFTGTLAAQLGTLPVTALMFKKVSLVSLAVNMFAIPLSNIALAAGFLIIIFSVFSAWLASVIASFNILLLFVQLKAISYFAGFDYAFFETYFVNFPFMIVYYLILILIYTISKNNYVSRIIIIVLIIMNFALYSSIAGKTDIAELTYIDAGNSGCTLIKMPEGTCVLINAGGSADNYFSAERNIIPQLKIKGISRINILFLNSLNLNEYKNLAYLMNHFTVDKIIIPVYYKMLFDDNLVKKWRFDFISEPAIFNKNGNFRIYSYYFPELRSESMMSELVFGEQSFIFNDSKDIQDDFINTYYLPEENALMVLKASGSGTFEYNSPEFIAKADPEFVVVSESSRRRRNKGAEIFEQSLNETGFTVLKTETEGAIIFESDGYVTNRVLWR